MRLSRSIVVCVPAVSLTMFAHAGSPLCPPAFNDIWYDEGPVDIQDPVDIEFGDVNGDGILDMVTTDIELGAGVHFGAGDGTFGARTDYAMAPIIPDLGSGNGRVELGDLNGDGDLDIAVVGFAIDEGFGANPDLGPLPVYINNGVFFRLNNGDGTFGPVNTLSGVADTLDLTIADIDGDNDMDIVAIEFDNFFGMLVWKNNGSGTFGPRQDVQTNIGCVAVDSGDLDGDGDIDIAIARSFSHELDVLFNNGTGSFSVPTAYPVSGARPERIHLGDANGDGDLDIAITVDTGNRLNVFTNDGSGGFGVMQNITTGSDPRGVRFADIDGDNDLDIITASGSARTLNYHLNDGSGTFGVREFFSAGGVQEIDVADLNNDGLDDVGMSNNIFSSGYTVHLAEPAGFGSDRDDYSPVSDPLTMSLMDFNSDGKTDIAVSRLSSSTPNVAVMVNAGDGTYPTKIDLSAGAIPYLTTGDVNGDNLPDIVTANLTGDNMSVFINNGAGGYSGAVNTFLGDAPSYPELGDIDNDGDLDYAATRNAADLVVLMFNDGSGSFGGQTTIPVADSPFRLKMRDLNADGNLDIVVPRRLADVVAVMLGNGDGTFGVMTNYSVDEDPNSVQIGDMDGDGDLDIVSHNIRNNGLFDGIDSLTVLFNDGSGVFSGAVDVSTREMDTFHIGDVDDDGDLDMVGANSGITGYTVLLNTDGSGTNWSQTTYLDGRGTRIAETADINEDGVTDVITGQATGFISIHYGRGCDSAGCPADFTGDGTLDIFDVFGFLDAFNSMDPSADFTGDGLFDIFDVFAFLDAFNAGCP
ncbi:MAG: VCBS repeat-containing protein [Phycisphaerales bacterium]|nr:VCBS repeat-containing protein [Phycisphaerales bacterium]